jgi:hypothetical protein
MEPVSAITTALTITKTAGEITKKLYDFAKSIKDRDAKQHVDEILDQLRELKQSAADLEQENRELREKLRFKSDEYVFRTPFWYGKNNPDRALCPKCFAGNIAAPMDDRGMGVSSDYRCCLVCNNGIDVASRRI